MIADAAARSAVAVCAQVTVCNEWLNSLATDPRKFTIRTGPTTQPRNAGEADLHIEDGSGILARATITIAPASKLRRLGVTADETLAHELGHVVGTLKKQEQGLLGKSNTCDDTPVACADLYRQQYVAAKRRSPP